MDRTYCPHCSAKWFIEELNYTIFDKMNGYKISSSSITIENSAKKNKN